MCHLTCMQCMCCIGYIHSKVSAGITLMGSMWTEVWQRQHVLNISTAVRNGNIFNPGISHPACYILMVATAIVHYNVYIPTEVQTCMRTWKSNWSLALIWKNCWAAIKQQCTPSLNSLWWNGFQFHHTVQSTQTVIQTVLMWLIHFILQAFNILVKQLPQHTDLLHVISLFHIGAIPQWQLSHSSMYK